jgi:hypothetical protein
MENEIRLSDQDDEKVISSSALHAALDLWSRSGEQHYLPIRGKSMLPMLREGDEVLVAHTRDLQPGEIAVFQQPGGLIAHRVLLGYADDAAPFLRTKGDNVLGLDPPVPYSAVVGRAVSISRRGRILDMDTAGWRRTGKMMAFLGKAQASLYYRSWDLSPDRDLAQPTRYSAWAGRAFRVGNAILLRLCLVIIGRWQVT